MTEALRFAAMVRLSGAVSATRAAPTGFSTLKSRKWSLPVCDGETLKYRSNCDKWRTRLHVEGKLLSHERGVMELKAVNRKG
jgi:hypothetical protein